MKPNPTPCNIRESHSSKSCKSKRRASAWLSSDAGPMLGCMLLTSGCLLIWQRTERATLVDHCFCWLFFGSEIQEACRQITVQKTGVRLRFSDGYVQISKLKTKYCKPWLLRGEICSNTKANWERSLDRDSPKFGAAALQTLVLLSAGLSRISGTCSLLNLATEKSFWG